MTEVVIVSAVRTPIGKIRGALAAVRPDNLAAIVIREAVERAGIGGDQIEEVYLGCANQAGRGQSKRSADGAAVGGLAGDGGGGDDK